MFAFSAGRCYENTLSSTRVDTSRNNRDRTLEGSEHLGVRPGGNPRDAGHTCVPLPLWALASYPRTAHSFLSYLWKPAVACHCSGLWETAVNKTDRGPRPGGAAFPRGARRVQTGRQSLRVWGGLFQEGGQGWLTEGESES